jgi:putative drug exporter of the RND superfamily
MASLARFCFRRRWLVAGLWCVLLLGAGTANALEGGPFRDELELPGSESQEAFTLLEAGGMEDLAGFSGQIVFAADDLHDDRVEAWIGDLLTEVDETVPDSVLIGPYDAEHQMSDDATVAYADLNLADRGDDAYDDAADTVRRIVADSLTGEDHEPQVELGGELFIEEGELGNEMVGVAAAAVILLIAFGSVLAMGLPLATALFGIGTGVAVVGLSAHLITMPTFATQAVLMIGIGVGIDYSLFIVTRYREALARNGDPEQATTEAMDTAGRAVLVAGTTVVISVLGLLLAGLPMVHGLAVGISIGVLTTLLATLTLLPAVLGFVGTNVDRFGLPHRKSAGHAPEDTAWHRWSQLVERRPWPVLALAVGVLAVLALPLLGLRLGYSDAGNRPADDTTRRAYDLMAEGFGPGSNGPLLLAADVGPEGDPEDLTGLWQALDETDGVSAVLPPQPSEDDRTFALVVLPESAPQDAATTDLVHELRDRIIPAATEATGIEVKVGGLTAATVDLADHLNVRLFWLIGAVLGLSFVVLVAMFRSVLVPLKAVIVNLFSVGAAYGVLVAVFQWGWASNIIDIGREGPIDAWIPMMMFAVVFGLSMDYEVFLLSRMRERFDETGDSGLAVADGLAVTARVITAAAAIMVCVFGAFVLSDDRSLSMAGLGLATAIAVDASITRMMVVPAVMALLGPRAWWCPRWLARLSGGRTAVRADN